MATAATQTFDFAPTSALSREAASREREERLNNARKKLKTYRAKQGKVGSSASSFTSSLSTRSSKRDSLGSSSTLPQSPASHAHRRSASKSSLLGAGPSTSKFLPASPARATHARRISRSRGSRTSISFPSHGHSRSRASISMSASTPFQPDKGKAVDRLSSSELGTKECLLPAVCDSHVETAAEAATSEESARRPSVTQISIGMRDETPLPPPTHGRRASRHSRQLSVSNFRESLEIVSGQGHLTGALKPAASSFAPSNLVNPRLSPELRTTPTISNWSHDPERVLQALKERGRLEEEESSEDSEAKRSAALEALEGKISAPAEIIHLDAHLDEAPAQHATSSSSYSFGDNSTTPTFGSSGFSQVSSPMMGLGFNTSRRGSWGTAAPVTTVGARGVMDLGMLIEEEEEDAESENSRTASPRRRTPKKRPETLRPTSFNSGPSPHAESSASASSNTAPSPAAVSPAFAPKRLSLSASASPTPGTSANSAARSPNSSRNSLRELSLSPSINMARTDSSTSSNDDKKRHSLLLSQASAGAANDYTRQGSVRDSFRHLSMGASNRPPSLGYADSPRPRPASPIDRRTVSLGLGPAPSKRSSISYRNTSHTVGQRRTWRNSSINPPATPAQPGQFRSWSATEQPTYGSFGDLVQEGAEDSSQRFSGQAESSWSPPARVVSPTSVGQGLSQQLLAVRAQLEHLRLETSHLSATHALEIAEFEKKAIDEAASMRGRIEELERDIEEVKLARKFEVDGLSRELEQAKEVVQELTDERDSLREDVDGWRTRCASLEQATKRDREEDNLAKAQAKLINEMRDQIYNLVAALESERLDHAETKREMDQLVSERAAALLAEQPRSSAADTQRAAHRHISQANSDVSLFSTSSFGRSYSGNTTEDTSIATDLDESTSTKAGSPVTGFPGHSPAFPAHSLSRRGSEMGSAAALGGLQTLAEEEEEDDEQKTLGNETGVLHPADLTMTEDEMPRGQSAASTLSTDLSEAMPSTPHSDRPPTHNRSGSFVRHWSFPKGHVQPVRLGSGSDDDHIFFDLGRHTSLPALPIPEHILPPFLGGDLTIDDDEDADDESETPYQHQPPSQPQAHLRRPSSPRPSDRMQPHTRRFSGQYASRAPPVAPSALASAALAHSAPASANPISAASNPGRFSSLYRLLGGWTPNNVPSNPPPLPTSSIGSVPVHVAPPPKRQQQATTMMPPPPPRTARKFVQASQQPVPRAAPLAVLNFATACCEEDHLFVV